VNTLKKCVDILTLFADFGPVLSVAEIAERLHFPQSTTYRYISALKNHGLLEEDMRQPGYYHLGMKLLHLARSVTKQSLLNIALPVMEQISRQTGETVILSGLRQGQGICLEKVEGHHALRVSHERGAVFPLHAGASGKALLAYLDEDEQNAILQRVELTRFSETTITDPKKLKVELKRIREQGYAESDGEVIQGTYGIGVPLFSASGGIVAVLSVSAPRHRLEGVARKRMIQFLVTSSNTITERLQADTIRDRSKTNEKEET
jgi:DNA-binding IclR family transcriptional regulator